MYTRMITILIIGSLPLSILRHSRRTGISSGENVTVRHNYYFGRLGSSYFAPLSFLFIVHPVPDRAKSALRSVT